MSEDDKVFIIGGLGHIGLTLAAVLDKYYHVYVNDIDETAIARWSKNKEAIFHEPGLNERLYDSSIIFTRDITSIRKCNTIIITIGTPVDEYLNPDFKSVYKLMDQIHHYINDEMLLIFRSTFYPGTTKNIEKYFVKKYNLNPKIAFCPERVSGGAMVQELIELPQIVSANNSCSLTAAITFFEKLKVPIKALVSTDEGELSKLFTNAYRYVNFAIANQFYMLAKDFNVDFYSIYRAMTEDYPRMEDFPKPYFTAGYCLRKDTLQLAAWNKTQTFSLGYDASVVNESLPLFVFRKLRESAVKEFGKAISELKIGLLGMSFKPGIDDTRDSLAYRLKNILQHECKEVLCTDPYVKGDYIKPLNEVLNDSDVLILTCNHPQYQTIRTEKKIVDIINFFGKGDCL